jgi:hypothetical protein
VPGSSPRSGVNEQKVSTIAVGPVLHALTCDDGGLVGANFKPDQTFTPSAVGAKWKEITDFSSGSEYPTGMEQKNPMVSLLS